MIKGKKIQSSNIQLIQTVRNINNIKKEQQGSYPLPCLPKSLTKNQQGLSSKLEYPLKNEQIGDENAQNIFKKQQSKIKTNKNVPSDDKYPEKITNTNQKKPTNKAKNVINEKQKNIKDKRKENNQAKISEDNHSKKQNQIISKMQQAPALIKLNGPQINEQIAQPIEDFESEGESQQMQRMSYPAPIPSTQTQSIDLLDHLDEDNYYSFHPHYHQQEKHDQADPLAINMQVFELTADQILALDYFTI